MLFFCAWPDAPDAPCSLLIDASTKARAIELAAAHADGPKPSRVESIAPDVFVCEVIETEPSDRAESDLYLEPLDATDTLLFGLEFPDEVAAAGPLPVMYACHAEAEEDDGSTLRCTLPVGHEGEHRAGDAVWSDDDA